MMSMSSVSLRLSRHRGRTEATEDRRIEVMADPRIEGEASIVGEEDRSHADSVEAEVTFRENAPLLIKEFNAEDNHWSSEFLEIRADSAMLLVNGKPIVRNT